MSTTNELPLPDTNQKLDTIIDLVTSFRTAMTERMDKLEEDARQRYVDLRQRIEKQDERLTHIEERLSHIEQDVAFLMRQYHHVDQKLDIFVSEFNLLKGRMREMEATRELRH